jgi:hypothetical protein
VIKQQLLDPAGIELYIESQDSALWPKLPAFPAAASDVPWLSRLAPRQEERNLCYEQAFDFTRDVTK